MNEPFICLITGASSGIGYQTALKLAGQNNCRVIALARRAPLLEQLREESGNKIEILSGELNEEGLSGLLQFLVQQGISRIDGLINNAGSLLSKNFSEIRPAELEAVYRVNVFAPFQLTQTLLPLLQRSPRAHVLNIGSIGGVQGSVKFEGLSVYSSSKGALNVLTECLALELKDQRISVNCLALGAVQTEMLSAAFPGFQAPLSSDQMAEFIAWFILNGQNYFNGKILPVALSTP